MLKQLPNSLTFLRLLLAVPIGLLILREQFELALWLGALAGLTDALDGYLARKLDAYSRLGAILDPIADKTMVTSIFTSLAAIGILPWYLAITVVARDLIIVCGAGLYHLLIGRFEFAPTLLSKANLTVQIVFCVLVLAQLVFAFPPDVVMQAGQTLVLFLAVASGSQYVYLWTLKAMRQGDSGHSG